MMSDTYQTYAHERNYGCRVKEFLYRGHRCVLMENDLLRVMVSADKGADILEFLYKPIDLEFLWRSYGGLRRVEHYRPSSPLAAGHFREHYPGGWHEMLPNGASPCEHRGAEFGFHGEATNLPWDYRVETDDVGCVEVKFRVRTVRLPLLVEKTLRLMRGVAELNIRERIINEAGQEVEILWGQHPTFGWPFLEAGCKVILPACRFSIGDEPLRGSRLAPSQSSDWPLAISSDGESLDLSIVPGPEVRSQDFIRLDDLAEGWFSIVNPHRRVGFRLTWDKKIFPMLGFWRVFRGAMDYPWYGMNYLIALEPACDLPSLSEAVRRGTALRLEPGVPLETELIAAAYKCQETTPA
jgi:uncharacterized protein DUF4432